jgi:hypothetical protein
MQLPVFEGPDLSLGLVLADTVRFLDLSGELVALTRYHVEMIVGELAPLLLHLALVLLPVTRNRIPIHKQPPVEGFVSQLVTAPLEVVQFLCLFFYLPGINGLTLIWQFLVVNVPAVVENNTGNMQRDCQRSSS